MLCVGVGRRNGSNGRCRPRWTDTGYVFTTEIGTPIDPDGLQRAWRKVSTRAGLGPLRFHALRHSAATVALAHGVPLEVISRRLGHARYAMTADVYAHVGCEAQRDAADAMQAALDG
jgi:integrase